VARFSIHSDEYMDAPTPASAWRLGLNRIGAARQFQLLDRAAVGPAGGVSKFQTQPIRTETSPISDRRADSEFIADAAVNGRKRCSDPKPWPRCTDRSAAQRRPP